MYSKLNSAILQTLAYGDVFDYPLTQEEIWKYLISANVKYPISNIQCQITLTRLVKQNKVSQIEAYFCLQGREKLIYLRKQREEISEEKIKRAWKIVAVLRHIPTVVGLGLTGSLSMKNAKADDDIDLLVITRSNTLWITRMLILLILELFGLRRKHTTENASGLLCANMLIDESVLLLPMQFHTLYGAHEVVQVVPLLNKKGVYTKFIQANNWVQNFLPNSTVILSEREESHFKDKNTSIGSFDYLSIWIFSFVEPLARFFQLKYMKKRQTREIVSSTLAAFHPIDLSEIVMAEFTKRIEKYEI